jgi:HEAT repeat protein
VSLPGRLPAVLCAVLCAIPVAGLGGCRQGSRTPAGTAPGAAPPGPGGAAGSPQGGYLPGTAEGSARTQRFIRVDTLIAQWDALQAEGREEEAVSIAGRIQQEVNADYASFVAAARGDRGLRNQYLAVQALGFASDPSATSVLVERLSASDPQLVGNALIALKIRSDSSTPLPPLIALLTKDASEPRRFAPLALANVLIARERAGVPLETAHAERAMSGLVGLIQDRDPYVRLHAAKAMGALRRTEAVDFLVMLLRDDHVRIRIAAAAALERIGDVRAFPQVVRLLDDCDADTKAVVRDVLITYAERLQGAPLSADERAALGTSVPAWNRWYGDRKKPPPPK